MAGHVPDWLRGSHKKTTNSKVEHGVKSRPIFHAVHNDNPLKEVAPHSAAAYMADGGDPTEAQLKQMGLDASNAEREAGGRPGIVEGFKNLIGRFKEGNIDSEGSLAYERYGAGRGRREYENQKAFAENAKMQGDGMRNAKMVMSGQKMADSSATTTAVPSADESKPKDLTSKPSMSYQNSTIDEMKTDAMTGGTRLPKMDPNAVMRPMGDPEPAGKKTRSVKTRKDAPAANTAPNSRGTKPAEPVDSTAKRVVIRDNPRPPADNATRKSKPYPKDKPAAGTTSKPYPKDKPAEANRSKPVPEKADRPAPTADTSKPSKTAYGDFSFQQQLEKEKAAKAKKAADEKAKAAKRKSQSETRYDSMGNVIN